MTILPDDQEWNSLAIRMLRSQAKLIAEMMLLVHVNITFRQLIAIMFNGLSEHLYLSRISRRTIALMLGEQVRNFYHQLRSYMLEEQNSLGNEVNPLSSRIALYLAKHGTKGAVRRQILEEFVGNRPISVIESERNLVLSAIELGLQKGVISQHEGRGDETRYRALTVDLPSNPDDPDKSEYSEKALVAFEDHVDAFQDVLIANIERRGLGKKNNSWVETRRMGVKDPQAILKLKSITDRFFEDVDALWEEQNKIKGEVVATITFYMGKSESTHKEDN